MRDVDPLTIYVVQGLDGTPRCWMCADRGPVIDGRWCSNRCKREGEKMVAGDPTPHEISQAAIRIRATWSTDEEETRRRGSLPAGLHGLLP
jgi:hypothetical protein